MMHFRYFDRNADLLLLAYELVQSFYNYLFYLVAFLYILYEWYIYR